MGRATAVEPLDDCWDLIPVHEDRIRLHSVISGAGGVPLVLIHGMASSWRQWRGSMERLKNAFPLTALDLPGFGLSAASRAPMAFQDFADAAEQWCRQRGWGQLAGVGHSFGGAVLLDWASRYPDRFRRVALLAPAAIDHPWFRGDLWGLQYGLIRRLAGPLILWVVSTQWVGRRLFGHIVTDLNAVERGEVLDLQWGCRRAREMLRALHYYRFDGLMERLDRIRVPVLLGWGSADRVVPPEDADAYLARLPQAEIRWFQGCGHVPMVERRAECDDVLRWAADAHR